MKILWFSNISLDESDIKGTGTWIYSLAHAILDSTNYEIANVTFSADESISCRKINNITEWKVPQINLLKIRNSELNNLSDKYAEIIKTYNPDIIHIWGVESSHAKVISICCKDSKNVLLEIQGLIGRIAPFVDGGLSLFDQFKCIGLREILRSVTLFQLKIKFFQCGMIENNLIQRFKYICAPSLWMENHVKFYNSEALVFQNHLMLRSEYYSANKWDYSGSPVIICSSGYPAAFKGIHDLVKATHILKVKGINIRLRIIGNFNSKGIKGDGYSKYLKNLILELGLLDSVEFLGPLNSSDSISAMLNSSVMVFPSYVESYGVAFAEAMYVGVPTICAYNGGSSFLGIDNQTTLFFEAGDFQWCSQLIENIIGDKLLGEKLSKNAIEIAEARHSIKKIIDKQISIYENIIFEQS